MEDEAGYAALFGALAELESERAITGPAANALRLIALTGTRRGEIVKLRGRHLELTRHRIVLAPQEHKTGRRTGPTESDFFTRRGSSHSCAVSRGNSARRAGNQIGKARRYDLAQKALGQGSRSGRPSDLSYDARLAPLNRFAPCHDRRERSGDTSGVGSCEHRHLSSLYPFCRYAKKCPRRAAAAPAIAGLNSASLKGENVPVIPLRLQLG